jgi:threonine/homoserine/homoserine lactone efflux protein
MDFIPGLDTLAAFTLAALVLILTPGPDMAFFLGQTIAAGRARGFVAMLGACTGVLGHAMLAAFGLSALLLASATAFTVVKIAGVAYLVWLAIQAIRRGSALTLSPESSERRSLGKVFAMGIAINLLNPKIVMFFVTFLPQFVSADDAQASGKLCFSASISSRSQSRPAACSSSPQAALRVRCGARRASCGSSTTSSHH